MRYRIANITKKVLIPEGKVIIVHAEQFDSPRAKTDLFVFPEHMEDYVQDNILEEYREQSYWEPDFEEEYLPSMIVNINGEPKAVYKHPDFIEEYPFEIWFPYMVHERYGSLTDKTFNCFVLNNMVRNAGDNEYSFFYVFNPATNDYDIKPYYLVDSDRYIFLGKIEIMYFIEYMGKRYGDQCANFFLEKIIEKRPWLNKAYIIKCNEIIDFYFLIDIAKEYFKDDIIRVEGIKQIIARLFLAKRGLFELQE